LRVRTLSKIRSFSNRYRKKKAFFDVLSYQKLYKFKKYQDRKLKIQKLRLLQDELQRKKQLIQAEIKSEEESDEEFVDDEEDSECASDSNSEDDLAEFESEDENEYDSDEYEYMEDEEYDSFDEEECCESDENLEIEPEEGEIERENHTSVRNLIEKEKRSENELVDYDTTDDENSLVEEHHHDHSIELENNGNEICENLNEISNVEELNVSSDLDHDDVEALMAMQFRDTRLESHIREHNLNLIPRDPTRNDGNCWYDAIADQIVLHEVPNKPTNHVDLRKAVVAAIPNLPQAKEWIQNIFGSEETFSEFLEHHKSLGTWTDSLGIMCQATALFVQRTIHIVGTANIGQGFAFTKLESVDGSEDFPPFTVGYYQDRHYQSLQERPAHFDSDISYNESESSTPIYANTSREVIDEERLLDESLFESDDSEFDEVYNSDDELDSFDNSYVGSDGLTDMMIKVDKIRAVQKDDLKLVEPTVKSEIPKSRNLLHNLF